MSLIHLFLQNLFCNTGRHEEVHDESGRENRTFLIMEDSESALRVAASNSSFLAVGIGKSQ